MKEIGEYVTSQQEQEKQNFMKSARLFDNVAMKIILGTNIIKPKIITLHEQYPDLFNEEQQLTPVNMSPERKEKVITDTWKAFLGK